jgi:uncharacterized protein (TIGR03437 family)
MWALTGFMKTKTTLLVLLFGACAWQASAQSFDSSGDGMLNGTYYFRQVLYFEQMDDAVNIVGNITFDGNGNYTLSNATFLELDSQNYPTPVAIADSGTYSISASGEGYITALDSTDFPNDQIIGLVSQKGVFIGSSTETSNQYNDLFIAAPAGSANNGTLSGSYQVAYFDWTFAGVGGDALISFNANGSGGIGTVNATEFLGSNGPSTGPISGVTYSFSNGAAQINFGPSNPNNLISGTEILYTTPDGSFIFGGNFNGFDMFVGVQNATSNPSNYQALYYQAGINVDESSANNGLDSYFGATNILPGSNINIIADERDNSLALYSGSADYTYSDVYTLNGDGSANDSFYTYWASLDGTTRIGFADPSVTGFDTLGINVAFQAPSLSGPGVYLSPIGVTNAASSAPFTAFVSPGEFLTLYGSGLAPTTYSASVPFPTNLSGVQVMINDVAAPIYFVSPTEIDVIVPYVTTQSVAQIQVINNGADSNIVTQFTGQTSVGVFTNNPVGGIGYAAALRPDGSIISESNPAQVGETEAVYLAGMGATSNQPGDGAAAPGPPNLADTNAAPEILLVDSSNNSAQATVTFSGLAPGFAGLYQINFTIPSGLVNGDTALDIFSGSDSETAESGLPITGGTASAVTSARTSSRSPGRRLLRHKRYQIRDRSAARSLRAPQP